MVSPVWIWKRVSCNSRNKWMPATSQKALPRLRRRARRLGRRTPFARLVRHFLVRMVREGHADSTELQLGIGPLLGLLAAPGACLCFLMLNHYSSLLNWFRGRLHEDLLIASAPDKYLFLSIAMGITGIVTALKWDRTLPDSQDYLNLAPLPLRPRDILLANAARSLALIPRPDSGRTCRSGVVCYFSVWLGSLA